MLLLSQNSSSIFIYQISRIILQIKNLRLQRVHTFNTKD